jgi:ribosomal protein L11 methyltransferase
MNGEVFEAEERDLGGAFLGNWVEDGYSFLFFGAPARDAVSRLLKARVDLRLVEEHRFSYEEWQGGGLDPIRTGSLVIVPPWVPVEAGEGVIPILLDPGVVFGTGIHPTTRHCLEALCFLQVEGFPQKALDLGTGTGILALASAFLGAREVLAVDLNPLCVKTARRNVALNHLEGRVRVAHARAEEHISAPAELLVANIHYPVVEALVAAGGFDHRRRVLLSGLLRSQAGALRGEMRKLGFRLAREWDHEMTWYTMLWDHADLNGAL